MLVVADVNALWRSRPFEALSALRPVLGLQPMDPLVAIKQRHFPWGTTHSLRQKMRLLSAVLPFGWATRSSARALPRLWALALRECEALAGKTSALVVTSPHYAPLVEQLSAHTPTFYYCSDDYSNYGWDAETMRKQENIILRHARHSFFVSAALRDEMIRRYGIDSARTSVSMNATEEGFLSSVPQDEFNRLLQCFPNLKRPIAGVIGAINERLDFDLLSKVASLKNLGTLVLVGPIVTSANAEMDALLKHPRVLAVGDQPHSSIPAWQQLLDVALIPYRESRFNSFCSPLRLFDHLAAGRPIVSTAACSQIYDFSEYVRIAENETCFLNEVSTILSEPGSIPTNKAMREYAREHTWRTRTSKLNGRISEELGECPSVYCRFNNA